MLLLQYASKDTCIPVLSGDVNAVSKGQKEERKIISAIHSQPQDCKRQKIQTGNLPALIYHNCSIDSHECCQIAGIKMALSRSHPLWSLQRQNGGNKIKRQY